MSLEIKRKIFLEQAERLYRYQQTIPGLNTVLVKGITGNGNFLKGDWNVSFIQQCILDTEEICKKIIPNYESVNIEFKSNTISFWKLIDKRCKKARPVPGDIIVYHNMLHGKVIDSGTIGIVTNVFKDLSIETLEGGTISSFDDVPEYAQKTEIRRKVRPAGGTNLIRSLGSFSLWTDRE